MYNKFAVVFPWPGVKNAETELISRLKIAAKEQKMECVCIDNFGTVLDDEYELTKEQVCDVDFIISTHFETPKVKDVFYYHTLWNPPEFPLDRDNYIDLMNNYVMYDDYLIYDKGSMSNHLKSMLLDCPRELDGASPLMSTFPKSAVISPNLDDPKLFYCGMNWDVLVDKHGRNESLMKLLDNAGVVKIFGPNASTNKAWGGIHPWGGYKCYQYPIPFDGFTLLQELNKCGVCLVLSSDVHRRAGAVTNRAFEACAAGAVIISDNNPLMKEMFGDAALFVDYNKNEPRETYNQIIEKYEWICSHKQEALAMAKKSQEIFLDRYTLNGYLDMIVKNHPERIKAVERATYAIDKDKEVLVVYVLNTIKDIDAKERVEKVLSNINCQKYPSIKLQLIIDEKVQTIVEELLQEHPVNIQLEVTKIFGAGNVRQYTDGQLIFNCLSVQSYDYFMLMNADEVWFSDHVTTLVRSLENNNTLASYSGQLATNKDGKRWVHFFNGLDSGKLFIAPGKGSLPSQMIFPYPGCFIFSKKVMEYLPNYIFDCLDGREYMAILHLLYFKYEKKIAFSKRMTFAFPWKYSDEKHVLVNDMREWRFIMGLTNYNSNDKKFPLYSTSMPGVRDFITGIPLKSFIRIRFYRILMRFSSEGSALYNFLAKRYMKAVDDYNRLSRV